MKNSKDEVKKDVKEKKTAKKASSIVKTIVETPFKEIFCGEKDLFNRKPNQRRIVEWKQR